MTVTVVILLRPGKFAQIIGIPVQNLLLGIKRCFSYRKLLSSLVVVFKVMFGWCRISFMGSA